MDTPTINVNLKPCDAPHLCSANGGEHVSVCAAKPVLAPLSLEPWRSVTFMVRLGECTCQKSTMHSTRDWHPNEHSENCPARPVRVSCSISGKTWEESEVSEVDTPRHPMGPAHKGLDEGKCWCGRFHDEAAPLLAACRERWALVKALVTGRANTLADIVAEPMSTAHMTGLLAQRDAVFAALADMARAEQVIHRGELACARHMPRANVPRIGPSPAASWLAAYVWHLIEQVGAL